MSQPGSARLLPRLVLVAALAPALAAQQLPLPAEGQPPYLGSGWTSEDAFTLAEDVNADGHPDLLRVDAELAVALNNGNAVFRPFAPLALPNLAASAACGDLDGDGHADLVLGSTSDFGSITTLKGDGLGGFTLVQTVAATEPRSVALADFDLDGRLDVVAAWQAIGQTFQILPGHGDGTLGAAVPVGPDSIGNFASVDAADWNLDGDPDVLAARAGKLQVLENQGAGSFSVLLSAADGAPAFFTDLNADGWVDVLDGFKSGDSSFLVQRIHGGWDSAGTWPVLSAVHIAVERQPADGFPDVLVGGDGSSNIPQTLQYFANTSGTLLNLAGIGEAQVHQLVRSVAIADFNGDGHADLLAGGAIHFPTGTKIPVPKTFSLPSSSNPANLSFMTLADLDGNARADLVAVDNVNHDLLWVKGKAPVGGLPFSFWNDQGTLDAVVDLVTGDADGDGDTDVIQLVGGSFAKLAVNLGDGADDLGPAVLTDLPVAAVAAVTGDLDADGLDDVTLLSASTSQSTARAWLATGVGSFAVAGSVTMGGSATRIGLGDVDGDGALDLLAVQPSAAPAGELLVCAGDGAGQFAPGIPVPQSVSVFGNPVTGDFDADGRLDVATPCAQGVALFRNQVAGFSVPVVGGIPDPVVTQLIAADLDDDGALDLAATTAAAFVYVVRGDGAGGFEAATAHPAGRATSARSLAAADLDLDGTTDVLQASTLPAEFRILYRKVSADSPWVSIGGGVAGAAGQPRASGSGEPVVGQAITLDVDRAAPGALSFFVLGFDLLDQAFKGAHLVPTPDLVLATGFTEAGGKLHIPQTWPADAPAGLELWMQVFLVDPSAAHGLAATGGLRLRVP